ncbi:hypothetical protein BGL34_03380 [Fructilactobacillus lindneri]|nr:hypothetical protein [Fructilactobacillus lindneri]ANZ57831.1 hypothetical protein AYR60_03150 [Fructilactobacillus lindneri]ANZ59100.1 hypothetical protein AYR59_03150 [Fructilactobacillus lindneri]POG98153.1 hypothetical protein BGL31_03480 [Fructilactobacillus lindneri]POH01731.1 hypothetical protein BGL32_03950 [Fructilactobacillus lindneri]POH03575.1 hypothetical protein BGL33_02835 [Fructilactobacillus lindneri]
MSKKKLERQEREKIAIDMNDFLIKYAESILGPKPDLAQQLYEAGKNDLTGLDKLLEDDGYGRKNQYENLAQGFICDFYHIEPEDGQQEKAELAREAINYLGKNANKFNQWAEE